MKHLRNLWIILPVILSLALPSGLTPAAHAGNVIYVNAAAAGDNNGSNWSNAYTNLQAGLAMALAGDEVWVAAGTYRPAGPHGAENSFVLTDGVAVYGGFAGDEVTREERDWEANVTILSGNAAIPPAYHPNPPTCHVVRANEVGPTTILDGFTVTGGRTDLLWVDTQGLITCADFNGAGIWLNNSSPTLHHLKIRENFVSTQTGTLIQAGAGGGIYSAGGSPTITDVTVEDNEADTGGGIALIGGSPLVAHATVRSNYGQYGGGIAVTGGANATIADLMLAENHTGGLGGGIYVARSNVALANVVFWANQTDIDQAANRYGAAGGLATGYDYTEGAAWNISLHNVTMADNTAGIQEFGQDVWARAGHVVTIANSIFWHSPANPSQQWPLFSETVMSMANSLVPGVCWENSNFVCATTATNVITGDPKFVDVANGDLRLRPDSPSRNTGNAALLPADAADLDGDGDTAEPLPLDYDGNPRVVGSDVDMGAYEHQTDTSAPPVIITHPASQTVCAGSAVSFSATASGDPTPTVWWVVSTDRMTWQGLQEGPETELTFTASSGDDGKLYEAWFYNDVDPSDYVRSNTAMLTVNTAASVTTNPDSVTVGVGEVVTFVATAGGDPTPTVQWQVSANDGSDWSDIEGATENPLQFTVSSVDNGKQYRAVFSNGCGAATSEAATLTLDEPPTISCPPDVGDAKAGQPVNLGTPTVNDDGTPVPTVSNNAPATYPLGLTTVVWTATDSAGQTASCQQQVTATYLWSGFFQPVDNEPVLNQMKAGAGVAVRFSLGCDQGLSILASGYPVSRNIHCGTSSTLDEVELTTVSPGGLTYDPASGQYVYTWKTDKKWAGTCRQLVVRLVDGTEHLANFKFR